jgi:cystathionine beta-lyase/cystathionine gamma-synthase
MELEILALSVNPGEGSNRPQASSISTASVWQMESPASADAALAGANNCFVYRRDGHPNERELAEKLAQLHGGVRAVIFAQGMSSIACVALSVLKPGATVWVANELYGKTSKLFATDLTRWGVKSQAFDPTNEVELAKLQNSHADLVIVETLSNPRLRVPDLRRCAEAAHAAGALLMVDNTFATHLVCRPLEFGADVVIESLSKMVCGHSDSMLGLAVTADPSLAARLHDGMSTFGMASSPLDCYLTHRGLMTLALRIERAAENALALAKALAACELIERIDYPGLSLHPQHALAAQQFAGTFGWMLSFELRKDRMSVEQLFDALLPEIPFVPSLGDVCTTLSHPGSTSHRSLSVTQLAQLGISDSTVRVSAGIEPTAWVVDRFVSALNGLRPSGK